MSDIVQFEDREEFRKWLSEHCLSYDGIWLLFGKAGGPKTIKAGEALEEALCFGWIDGQMQRIDDKTYKKYFSMRREKIEEARKNRQWDAPKPMEITKEQITQLSALLGGYEPAFTNFGAMPLSVRKTYARVYFDAKTDAGRQKRIAWMVDRLNKNLKPM